MIIIGAARRNSDMTNVSRCGCALMPCPHQPSQDQQMKCCCPRSRAVLSRLVVGYQETQHLTHEVTQKPRACRGFNLNRKVSERRDEKAGIGTEEMGNHVRKACVLSRRGSKHVQHGAVNGAGEQAGRGDASRDIRHTSTSLERRRTQLYLRPAPFRE